MIVSAIWSAAEYRAGYSARFAGSAKLDTTLRAWREGWEDADTEIIEAERQRVRVAEGGSEEYAQTGMDLYHAGGQARAHDIPFETTRTRPWKQGWIDADIDLGVMEISN